MSQFRGAKVRVQNGIATVRQIWKATGVQSGSGTYGALSWAGSGVGVLVADGGTQLEWYRTSGALPTVGTVIVGAGGLSFTITSFPTENLSVTSAVAAYPADFAASATQGPIASGQRLYIVGEPVGIVGNTATIGSDSFDLTAAWGGTTLTNVEAVINRDTTAAYGWDVPAHGSRLPWEVLAGTLHRIDEAVNSGSGGGAPPGAFVLFTLLSPWRNVPTVAPAGYCYLPSTDSVQLRGMIDTNGSPVDQHTRIVAAGGLPLGRRPAYRIDHSFTGERWSVDPDGSIYYRTPIIGSVPGEISIACTFRADGS